MPPTSSVWLSGPGGSGKSTTIASYLTSNKIPCLWYQFNSEDSDPADFFYHMIQTADSILDPVKPALPLFTPEYRLGIAAFARRFFKILFQLAKPPFWIVLDNHQEISPESPLQHVIAAAIEQLPDGIYIAVLSRSHPPPCMVRLQANQIMAHIDWKDLKFATEECKDVFRLLCHCQWTDADVSKIHNLTQGWIAGIILWLLYADLSDGASILPDVHAPEIIFSYFASEVLTKLDVRTKSFLYKTSFLYEVTSDAANQMDESEQVADILEQLRSNNFFLEKRAGSPHSYQYHPLFKGFLRKHAENVFSTDELNVIRLRAADLSVSAGAVEHAAMLYQEAAAWDQLAELIQDHAFLLFFQGRHPTLSKWLGYLPIERISQNPWLIFWQGVGLLPDDPTEGRKHCTQAYELFCKSKDTIGQMLSFAAAVESFFLSRSDMYGLDDWIKRGEMLEPSIDTIDETQITGRFAGAMLGALTIRAPGHPSIDNWINRCTEMMNQSKDLYLHIMLANFLVLIHCWHGDVNEAQIILQWLKPSIDNRDVPPLQRILFNVMQCVYFQASGENRRCLRTAEKALSIGEETGVHVFDGLICSHIVYASLSMGNLAHARRFLDKMALAVKPNEIVDMAHYHGLCAWHAYASGNLPLALKEVEIALQMGQTDGAPVVTIISGQLFHVRLLMAGGARERAESNLKKTCGRSRTEGCILIEFQELLTHAQYYYAKGDSVAAADYLKRAFMLSREKNILDSNWWLRQQLVFFCEKAMEADIEVEQVNRFIQRHQLIPEKPRIAATYWAWPVKIHALGSFEIHLKDQPLEISAKTPKKPFELLRLLLCQSLEGISRETAIDQLWPDSEGDRSIQSLNTTLHRLRKLIGRDQAVIMKSGRLKLNSELCWVDVWYFLALLEQADSGTDPMQKKEYLEKSLSVYKRHFEISGTSSPIILAFAHQLRDRWLKAVMDTSSLLSHIGLAEKAVAILQQALVLDNVAEPLYQTLIHTLSAQGRTSEALITLNRCRSTLTRAGLEPTEDTIALLHRLQSGKNKKNR